MTKHEYGGIEISGGKNAFALGEKNIVNQYIDSQHENVTKQLLEQLNEADIPEDKKIELESIIQSGNEIANTEKPNKTIIKSLLNSANSIMDMVTKSPELIDSYEKWSTFLTSL